MAIEVGVHGGCVQWIRGVPRNTDIRVQDYDIDGVDTGVISADKEGNPCVVVIYRGGCDGRDDDSIEVPI